MKLEVEKLDLRKANKILMAVFLVLLGWFLLDLLLSLGNSHITIMGPEVRDEEDVVEEDFRNLPDFSYYSKEINKRRLFKGVSPQQKSSSADTAGNSAKTLAADFQLIGLAAGENPQVIIQNKKTRQSYFLYEGQSQDNLKVEEITENKVKLDYNGEIFELFF
jgi:hypothetical protein